jgi:phosphoribosylformylglycinamidine synthase subunit PurS
VPLALYQVRWGTFVSFREAHTSGPAADSGKICVHSQECPVARVVVDVMLKPEILDPQGQAVAGALPRLGVSDVTSVRIGRRIEIEFAGEPDLDKAREIADKLLANPVIEDFSLHIDTALGTQDGTVKPDSDSQESEPAEAPA